MEQRPHQQGQEGTLQAFVIVGDGYLDSGGEMGGCNIEERISNDDGVT